MAAEAIKTLVDQVSEIEKLISDGMERLAQAQFALRSLQRRVGPNHPLDVEDQESRE